MYHMCVFVSIREIHKISHTRISDISFPLTAPSVLFASDFPPISFSLSFLLSFCFWGTKGFSLRLLVTVLPPLDGRKREKTAGGSEGAKRGGVGRAQRAREETCFISASTIAKACWTGKSSGNYCIEQRSFTLFIPLLPFFSLTPAPPSSIPIVLINQRFVARCKTAFVFFYSRCVDEGVGRERERKGKEISGEPEVVENDW